MYRHTLTKALEMLRTRVAAGDPDLTAGIRFVVRSRALYVATNAALQDKVAAAVDKLLDETRYDATTAAMDNPFPTGPPERGLLLYRGWMEACSIATRNMAAPANGGLGLTAWADVQGLTRIQALGLITLTLQRLADMPEFGAGPLFPGLQR